MDVKIEVLAADHGDSILISCLGQDETKNVLIDGGPQKTFSQHKQKGVLQKRLDRLIKEKQKIDLLILTHVDDDHIGGVLAGFEKNGYLSEIVNEVWFNSGQLIFEHFNKTHNEEYQLKLKKYLTTNTSIVQGVTFEGFISELGIWHRKIIKSDDVLKRFGLNFDILSPNDENLQPLLTKWARERPSTLTGSMNDDYQFGLEELIENDTFDEDRSVHNASSISFILSYNDKAALFLGDALPSTVSGSLKKRGFSSNKKIKLEYMKVSHHGSKRNTDNELLSLIDCQQFIISTSGAVHNLPNKKTIARIINNFPEATILFNYPRLIHKIFKKDELDGVKFRLSDCNEPLVF